MIFSQIVDEIAAELVRPDLIINGSIAGYLNQTIRDMHIDSMTKMPVFYNDNRQEVRATVAGADSNDNVFLWVIPRVSLFQGVEAVYYPSRNKYAQQRKPAAARITRDSDPNGMYYWYRTGSQLAFCGHGGDGKFVDISWFEYPISLAYQQKANRQLTYDLATDTYTLKPGSILTMELAMAQSTNWMIQRYHDTLKEGVRAKVYKRLADETRMRTSYSQFENARIGIINTESVDMAPVYTR